MDSEEGGLERALREQALWNTALNLIHDSLGFLQPPNKESPFEKVLCVKGSGSSGLCAYPSLFLPLQELTGLKVRLSGNWELGVKAHGFGGPW